jgi:hypothetical protein
MRPPKMATSALRSSSSSSDRSACAVVKLTRLPLPSP